MICKNCGSEIADNAKHCTECGAAIVVEEVKVDPFTGDTPEAPPVPENPYGTSEEAPKVEPTPVYQQTSGYQSVVAPRIFERNIGVAIILSLVTCGIYTIYWQYKVFDDARIISGTTNEGSAGMDILLSIITCGIYLFYAVYKSAQRIYQAQLAQGENATDDSIMLTILTVFISIVSFALLQSKLNEYAKKYCN